MGTEIMGKVLVSARIENLEDLSLVDGGYRAPEQARAVEVNDALVDMGRTSLLMPRRLIQQLGLRPDRSRLARTSAGTVTVQVYEAVRLTILGHDGLEPVVELPDECPVMIGQLVLEHLDLVVDPIGQRVTGNPAHGGEQMIELY